MTGPTIWLHTPSVGYEQRFRQAFDPSLNGQLVRCDVVDAAAVAAATDAGQAPQVLVLGPDLDLDTAATIAGELSVAHPEVTCLLVAPPTPATWRTAARAGIRDVLAPDAPDAEVRAAVSQALETTARRRQALGGDEPGPAGRVTVVLSPKGGSGKTTIASNLAVGLARHAPDRVVLVDADLQFGDVGAALGLTPEHTLASAIPLAAEQHSVALKSVLTAHPSGLWVLCGADTPVEGEGIDPAGLRQLLLRLAGEFDHVVVDTSAGITEPTLAALDVATDLVLVCSMDVSSVRNLRKEVDALDALGMTGPRRHFVVNRADAKVGLDVRDVEATVGLPVTIRLSSSRAVPVSMNQGVPLLESQPRSPLGRQLTELVAVFAEPAPARTGRLLRKASR